MGKWPELRNLQSVLVIAFIAYGIFAIYIFLWADRLIFLPPPASYRHSPATDLSAINILTGYGEVIAARYLPNPQSQYTILYSHGNASDIGTVAPILQALYNRGFSVMAYDYPGYGHSTDSPSESGAYQAIETVYRYLTDYLDVLPAQIILHGQSLGGGPSTYLAAKAPVAGLILESTFATVFQVAFPFRILPFEKFPNIRRIGYITCPLLILHGSNDQTIPFHHSEALLAAAPEPKQLVTIEGAGHNDILRINEALYLNSIQNFAESLGPVNTLQSSFLTKN